MESRKIAILGGCGAALAAGIYVLWGPSVKKMTRKDIPGLANLGNTCFINAILQSMASCPSILQSLGDFIDSQINNDYERLFAFSLVKILKLLNNAGSELSAPYVEPTEIISALRLRGWVVQHDEQDAHEFFHVLTTVLEEESMLEQPAVISLFDLHLLQDALYQLEEGVGATKIRSQLPKLSRRQCQLPFRGLLASQLVCTKCHHRLPVRYDTFSSLSLPLNKQIKYNISLESCLQTYLISECVKDVSCENCAKLLKDRVQEQTGLSQKDLNEAECLSNLHIKNTFVKETSFGKLPKVLCLHLQRSIWLENGMPTKRNDFVSFPEYLDVSRYCKQTSGRVSGDQSINSLLGGTDLSHSYRSNTVEVSGYHDPSCSLYQLRALIVHYGGVFSGHFVTYRRSHKGRRWYCASDNSVRKVTRSEVFGTSAYMLFYEKSSHENVWS